MPLRTFPPSPGSALRVASSEGLTPYVFVLGTGRCGSTLIHELLARHEGMAFVSNIDDRLGALSPVNRWNSTIYRRVPAPLTAKGRLRFAPSEGYRVLERSVTPALSRPFRDLEAADATPWLRDRVRSFFEECRVRQDRPVLLHKFTGWPRIGFLRAVFPEARFINVVRDGRAVANSWLQMPWWQGYEGPSHWQWGPLPPAYAEEWMASGRSFPVLAGIAWKMLMDAFDDAAEPLGPQRYLEVRYEDVLDDPAGALAAMLGFIGLPSTAAFEARTARHGLNSDRRDAFVRDLPAEALDALQRSLDAHLRRRGYLPSSGATELSS